MTDVRNAFGQPVGRPLPSWSARPAPPATPMVGRTCRVEPLDVAGHAADLFAALSPVPADWTYMSGDPPADLAVYRDRLALMATGADPLFHAIVDAGTGRACGLAAFMRIDRANGTIEIGHIQFGPAMRRSAIGSEALALMMRRAFDGLGYRRLEWKCDALNAPSRAAALRLGFTFEGIFRQAIVTKGRNRDTAWFAIVDCDWPALRQAFDAWLAPANFDAAGRQKRTLGAFRGDPTPAGRSARE